MGAERWRVMGEGVKGGEERCVWAEEEGEVTDCGKGGAGEAGTAEGEGGAVGGLNEGLMTMSQ